MDRRRTNASPAPAAAPALGAEPVSCGLFSRKSVLPRPLQILIAFLWLAFVAGLHWNSLTMPFERDEGEYAYSAWLLRHGEVPYLHAFMQKPPLIIYTYAIAQLAGGDGVMPPRAAALLFLILSTVMLVLMIRRRYGDAPAFVLLWLFPLMAMAAHVSPFAANTERFMLLPLSAFLMVLDRPGQRRLSTWFWAGVFGALAVLYKPIPLFIIGFVCVYWFLEERRSGQKWPWRSPLALAAGALAATLACNLYFLLRGAGGALWECAVAFNFYYTQALPHHSAFLWAHLREFLAGWWILLPFAGYFFYQRPAHWLLYTLALAIGAFTIRQTLVSHYYILLVPFLAIIAALGFAATAQKVIARLSVLRTERAKNMALHVAILPVLFILVIAAPKQYALTPDALNQWIYRSPLVNPFVDAPLVAQKLAAITRPDDRVLVFGSEPELLYYAKRRSATRFVIMAPFLVQSPFYPNYAHTIQQELSASPPQAIVITPHSMGTMSNHPQGAQWLQALLANELKPFDPVGGLVVSPSGSHWEEPLPPEDAASATFIVCRRSP